MSLSAFDFSFKVIFHAPTKCRILVVMDNEGWFELLKIFQRAKETSNWSLENGDHFVFGGDLQDHGPNAIRLICFLLDIKEKYRQQVHFVLGNRDINKARFFYEISKNLWNTIAEGKHSQETADILKKGFPWVNKDFSKWDWDAPNSCTSIYKVLQFILEESMGAPNALKAFKTEMEQLRTQAFTHPKLGFLIEESLTDENVAICYLKTQWLFCTEFLFQGKVMHRDGKTVIVHGGFTANNFCNSIAPGDNLDDWQHNCNLFVVEQIKAMLGLPSQDFQHWSEWFRKVLPCPFKFDGNLLIVDVGKFKRMTGLWMPYVQAIVLPWRELQNLSVGDLHLTSPITDTWNEKNGANLLNPKGGPSDVLVTEGIELMVTGHQPAGVSGHVLKHQRVCYLNGDVTRAGKIGPGDAYVAFIIPRNEPMQTQIMGKLPDGPLYLFSISDPLIGQQQKDGWTVVRLVDGVYEAQLVNGFTVTVSRFRVGILSITRDSIKLFTTAAIFDFTFHAAINSELFIKFLERMVSEHTVMSVEIISVEHRDPHWFINVRLTTNTASWTITVEPDSVLVTNIVGDPDSAKYIVLRRNPLTGVLELPGARKGTHATLQELITKRIGLTPVMQHTKMVPGYGGYLSPGSSTQQIDYIMSTISITENVADFDHFRKGTTEHPVVLYSLDGMDRDVPHLQTEINSKPEMFASSVMTGLAILLEQKIIL